jgi:AcrR family transcriptional regulator
MIDEPAERRRERRKDVRPSEIVAAALELFVERGYAATRLDDIALRAGASKGTLYLYFESKEELFKAVVREGLLPALAEGEQLVDSFEGSAADLWRAFVRGWWEMIGSRPIGGLPKLMISEAGNFPEIARFYTEEVIERGHRLLRKALDRGVASGEFRPIADPAMTQHIVFAPLLMLVLWRHSFGCCGSADIDPDLYLEQCTEFILRGLQRTPD